MYFRTKRTARRTHTADLFLSRQTAIVCLDPMTMVKTMNIIETTNMQKQSEQIQNRKCTARCSGRLNAKLRIAQKESREPSKTQTNTSTLGKARYSTALSATSPPRTNTGTWYWRRNPPTNLDKAFVPTLKTSEYRRQIIWNRIQHCSNVSKAYRCIFSLNESNRFQRPLKSNIRMVQLLNEWVSSTAVCFTALFAFVLNHKFKW